MLKFKSHCFKLNCIYIKKSFYNAKCATCPSHRITNPLRQSFSCYFSYSSNQLIAYIKQTRMWKSVQDTQSSDALFCLFMNTMNWLPILKNLDYRLFLNNWKSWQHWIQNYTQQQSTDWWLSLRGGASVLQWATVSTAGVPDTEASWRPTILIDIVCLSPKGTWVWTMAGQGTSRQKKA